MKIDLLIVPTDILVVPNGKRPVSEDAQSIDHQFPSGYWLDVVQKAFAETLGEAPAGIRILCQLLATGVGARLEPLYPAPDDLLVEPGPRDAVWAQPAYLETVGAELVKHDGGELRLLIPSSRNLKARPFNAHLTRKGVRLWSERKAQRLSEGEHYLPLRRLADLETRVTTSGTELHVRFKPGTGVLLTVEVPDATAALPLPMSLEAGQGCSVRIEKVQYPQPSLDSKPKKRWRLTALTSLVPGASGYPAFLDDSGSTREPLPAEGKLIAVARRAVEPTVESTVPARSLRSQQAVIPVGTTYFIEFNEPVRIEPSAEILAGGS